MDRATQRQRNARRGLVRSARNRRTALTRLRARTNQAKMLRGIGRPFYGFPQSIITKLRYVSFVTLTAAGGTVAGNVFHANGIYDPDVTGTGHQPLYRDEYAALYSKYAVLGSKCTATFSAGAGIPAQVGILKDDDATTTSNLETSMEQSGAVFDVTGALGASPTTLVSTYSPLRDMGVDVKNDGDLQALQGGPPNNSYYFKVWAISADAVTATSVVVQVTVEYTVKFSELITPTQS